MDNLNNRYILVREKIFSLLKSQGIQQKDFAEAIGVPQQTVTDWKAGRSSSFTKRLDIISQALGTTTGELLGEKKPTPVVEDGLSERAIRLDAWFHSLPPETRKAILTLGGGPEDLAE